jgi:hypothetical protein
MVSAIDRFERIVGCFEIIILWRFFKTRHRAPRDCQSRISIELSGRGLNGAMRESADI